MFYEPGKTAHKLPRDPYKVRVNFVNAKYVKIDAALNGLLGCIGATGSGCTNLPNLRVELYLASQGYLKRLA